MQQLIDTHLHIWNIEKVEYPWLEGNTSILNRTYEPEDIIPQLEDNEVTGAILVQAANTLQETEWMLAATKRLPILQGVVGWANLLDVEEAHETLKTYQIQPLIKGVRHLIHDEPNPNWLLQPNVVESFSYLERLQLPYEVVSNKNEHLRCTLKLAEKYPDLPMVLDHCANPQIELGKDLLKSDWAKLTAACAKNPKMSAKISGLGLNCNNPHKWNSSDLSYALDHILTHFGPERCMIGGDWPVALLAGSYSHTIEQYRKALEGMLSGKDLEAVYSLTAKRHYRLA